MLATTQHFNTALLSSRGIQILRDSKTSARDTTLPIPCVSPYYNLVILCSVKTINGRAYHALLITLCIVYRLSAGAHCTSRVYISHAISQSETGNQWRHYIYIVINQSESRSGSCDQYTLCTANQRLRFTSHVTSFTIVCH